jgi:hypothetical protein
MTEPEYRQNDRTDTGYCPICGTEITTVYVDGGGWCPDHGRVWCDWTPRTGAQGRLPDDYWKPHTASGTDNHEEDTT